MGSNEAIMSTILSRKNEVEFTQPFTTSSSHLPAHLTTIAISHYNVILNRIEFLASYKYPEWAGPATIQDIRDIFCHVRSSRSMRPGCLVIVSPCSVRYTHTILKRIDHLQTSGTPLRRRYRRAVGYWRQPYTWEE